MLHDLTRVCSFPWRRWARPLLPWAALAWPLTGWPQSPPPVPPSLSPAAASDKPFDQVVVDAQGGKQLAGAAAPPAADATDWGEGEAPLSWQEFTRKMVEEGPTLTRANTKRVILDPPSREQRARSSAAFLVETFKLRRESEGRFRAYITQLKTETPLIIELVGMFGHTAVVQTASRFRDLAESDQRMFVQEWSTRWHQEVAGPISRLIVTDPREGRLYAIEHYAAVTNTADPLTIPLLAVNERIKDRPPPAEAAPPAPPPAEPASPAPPPAD